MSSKTPAILACAGSAAGLAVAIPAHFSKAGLESLCSQDTSCMEVFTPTVLGAETSAWVLGIFAGLAWISLGFLLGRNGYKASGRNLLILGVLALIFFSLRLRSTDSCLPCNGALAGAALVVIGGFLGRKEEQAPSNRAMGAFIALLFPILLVNGVLNEQEAFKKKLTPFAEITVAPELSPREFIWGDIGSKSKSTHVALLYADFTDQRASNIREAIKTFSAAHGGSILLVHRPVPEKGSSISASTLHCAPRNRAHEFAKNLSGAPLDAIAKSIGFSATDIESLQTCIDSDNTASKVRNAVVAAKDASINGPFHLLINKDTTWKDLQNKKRTTTDHWKHIQTNGGFQRTHDLLKQFFETQKD